MSCREKVKSTGTISNFDGRKGGPEMSSSWAPVLDNKNFLTFRSFDLRDICNNLISYLQNVSFSVKNSFKASIHINIKSGSHIDSKFIK